MWGRLSSLPVYRTFQSGGPKTGDSKVARTRRLESLRYEPVLVHGPNARHQSRGGFPCTTPSPCPLPRPKRGRGWPKAGRGGAVQGPKACAKAKGGFV